MPIKDAVATVLNRNAFYRDGYRLLLRISLIQTVVIALLIGGIVGLALTMKTRQIYFATSSDGRIIPIMPLSERYRTDADIITWAEKTAQDAMRFDYNDYRDRLQQSSSNFTQIGWTSFNKALKDANFIDAIQARKLVVALDINGAPQIQGEGVKDGVWTWYVQIPVTIKFDGNQPPTPISSMLHLQIVRVSTLQNADGVSIEQWIQSSPGPGGGQ
ncbi:MAG: DotI/IcmL/TraM family protein [Alphaproteobacteria bacterium]|nr:DotI/IcmL/TraM family protein [Alphaproteobacteria bacterium]